VFYMTTPREQSETAEPGSEVSWWTLARCRGIDPVVFHPAEGDPGEEAKEICALCPVRESCLDHALTAREKDGVWGGLTAIERRRLVRRLRRSA